MKHKLFALLMLVALLTMAVTPVMAADEPATQPRNSDITIRNKSGSILKVKLVGKEYRQQYYFEAAEGSRDFPTDTVRTIWGDTYTVQVWYASEVSDDGLIEELSACVTGIDLDLDELKSYKIEADKRDVRFTVTPCGEAPPNRGDHGARMYKWYFWLTNSYRGHAYVY